MKVLLRDPFLHFALLGAALFGLFVLLREPAPGEDEIVITAAEQEQLVAAFTRAWRREPTPAEMKGLIDDRLREELANREALAMGLAEDDPVIRRRLRQKYEAFMEQIAASAEPDEATLAEWLDEHAENYREDARYSLQQLFFSSDRRDDASGDARRALERLAGAQPGAGATIGDTIGLSRSFSGARRSELANRFGEEFAAALEDLPEGAWSGPVASAYGAHLVYIEGREPSRIPMLDEVRSEVLRDWREQRLRETRERIYGALLEQYTVQIEAGDARASGS